MPKDVRFVSRNGNGVARLFCVAPLTGGGMNHSQLSPGEKPWLVVATHPHKERLALLNLGNQHFEVYQPRVRRRVHHARRWQDVLRPLFPGYLFVRRSQQVEIWRSILSTYGVRSLVRCGERPSHLADDFIRCLKAREEDGVITRPAAPFAINQNVKLSSGPFDGLIARVIEFDETERVVVLLDLLSQSVRVKADVSQLALA